MNFILKYNAIIFTTSVYLYLLAATCTTFLQGQAEELGAEFQVMECVPGKPIVLMTLQGQDPSLQSVLLNSHTDVVPVFPVGIDIKFCLSLFWNVICMTCILCNMT